MIRDDKERVIGKLISINSEKFVVELLNQSINFTVNGFDDIYQYAQLNGYVILPYQDFHIVAEIFGVREKDTDSSWKGEKEQVLSKSNSVKYLDINPVGTIQKKGGKNSFRYGVSIFPTLYTDVLYIRKEELDIIFEVDKDEEEIIHGDSNGSKLNHLHIGTSTIFPDYGIKVGINGFFGAHSAVLGNTGSGKSCTISSMMQTLFKKEQFSACGASFIFFDVNGEYHKAFSKIENPDIAVKYYSIETTSKKDFEKKYDFSIQPNIEYSKFILPHWFLNIDEWALLLHASERTQLPILRNAINLLKMFKSDEDSINKIKNHILYLCLLHIFRDGTSPAATKDRIIAILSKFSTQEINLDVKVNASTSIRSALRIEYGTMPQQELIINFLEQEVEEGNGKLFYLENFDIPYSSSLVHCSFDEIEQALDLAILFEEAHGNSQIRDFCSSMITRYKSLRDRQEFNFLIKQFEDISDENYINEFLGKTEEIKKAQVTIIDLNSIEDDAVEVISCVLTRMIFDKLKVIQPRNTFPVNLVLEEAHRYISEHKNSSFGEANKIFNRVAKEGRKYGLFLLVSSQRPSELSRTVLSQCSNFIVHRIQNPEDLSQIRQMTPHISANVLSRLPSIPKQHALIFGHSVQIPALFKVNNADPTPNSSDNDITTNWFIPKAIIETEGATEFGNEEDVEDLL
jgi:DNA helicase HerA-like ATPase